MGDRSASAVTMVVGEEASDLESRCRSAPALLKGVVVGFGGGEGLSPDLGAGGSGGAVASTRWRNAPTAPDGGSGGSSSRESTASSYFWLRPLPKPRPRLPAT